jgi:hypothetical protein
VGCLARRPFWRIKAWCSSESPLPETQRPLVELVALQSVMSAEVADVLGYLLPPGVHCFQRLGGLPSTPAPAPFKRTGSSSPELHPSFRVRSCLSPAHCPRAPGTSSRVLLPFATRACGVHFTPGIPRPTKFRPQRFSRSRRLAPPHTVADLFHSAATSGIRSSGGFPATKPARLIDESCPHVVGECSLTASRPAAASCTRFASRALIRAAIRFSQQAD